MSTTKIELRGGPSGHDAALVIDGVRPKGVRRVELVADVNDVIRMTTYQFASVDVEVSGEVTSAYMVKVNMHGADGWTVLATSTADTVWEAIYDCARQLELAAKGSVQWTET